MGFIMTDLEVDIMNLFLDMDIHKPQDIDIWKVAKELDIWIHYYEDESKVTKFNGSYYILLNNELSPQEEYQDFAHELGHAIRHVGNQHKLRHAFRKLQEHQANNFMYQFCVPTFMLQEYEIANYYNVEDGIPIIAKDFNVTKEFARKRLIQFRNKIQQAKLDAEHREFMESLYPKAPPYSKETMKVMEELSSILYKKGLKK
ncbi:Zn-dependent peptidase ImmA (M78 family) [Lederbergia galactosidilyticus]|uniref:ImmA/IrrE family metallo-endopeptidase n=1 Tax=Lederbergia galactosidilytica TaxID=217031 RepID=UPI001AE21BD3|nr:ImmA/IrrE family metallo-endopeptidase [Lederbergia galactosidilytica]MBP1917221.1 Zn-dependent peptidase ImmA (M78 family) [Lederbergia galactosidilytica]